MTTNADCVKTADVLSLESIRSTLIRQEETIIFALIERAQFRHNALVYKKAGFGELGTPLGSKESNEELSFLEYMLIGTEALHSRVRRYTSPEEHSFFPHRLSLDEQRNLPDLEYPEILSADAAQVNFNQILLKKYQEDIVPMLTAQGDDEQHGSCTLCDIAALQALSRRVHYGKFVAESKYRSNPEEYQRLVDANDADGVMKLLTNSAVEKMVLRRARLKAATYGRDPLLSASLEMEEISSESTAIVAAAAASAVVAAIEATGGEKKQGKVDPMVIESIYKDLIIPLTKDIEVAYLFRRCGKDPPDDFAPDRMSVDAKTKGLTASVEV
eukprot:CAMPEP_0194226874 /NCGR_PEP_ID=MMETSP0156-20130528/42569_1 /TAXON_ID=33649 /ORGANISM="Thalassionema nitzschioides, Strain L26-B" /LENGTH=328 /DNA_ID=CAMNT_0038959341 /DNA_START=153 /DNA_END=1139 /DNA_ORIENTATION=-